MILTAFVREARREPRRVALSVAVTLLLVAVVAPFVIYAVPQIVGADQSYVVLSGSMEPSISPGDVVVVAGVDPTALAVGDVITFTRGAQDIPTTHRIVEVVTEDGVTAFRTMGDANEDPDAGTVPATTVIGRVALVLPVIGHIVTAVNTQIGFAALVITPFAILFITEAYDRFVKPRRDTEDADADATAVSIDEITDAPTADASTADLTGEPADPSGDAGDTANAGDIMDASDTADASDDGGFAVTSTDLTLVLVTLGALGAYSAGVAYATRADRSVLTLASVMVAVAAIGCLVFGLYVRSEAPAAAMAATADGPTTDGGRHERIVVGVPVDTHWTPRVAVSSVDALVRMADASNRWIVANPEDGEHVLYADGVAYVTESETEPTAEPGVTANAETGSDPAGRPESESEPEER